MSDTNSESPRTDAAKQKLQREIWTGKGFTSLNCVLSEDMAQLERELKEQHATALEYARSSDYAHSQLSQLKDVATRLAEALEKEISAHHVSYREKSFNRVESRDALAAWEEIERVER